MANIIKKVKVMQQDGTFTDYIPIGAEANNVLTNDGDSVQLKLNKKPYYYNNVADMKTDLKLKVGDMVITLGYYNTNDGGAGEYKIISGIYTDDGGSYHELDNGLFAELIVKDYINVKQFGAYGDGIHDDSLSIQLAINYAINKYKIFIDENIYLINTGLIINGNIDFELIGTFKTTENIALFTVTSSESVFKINHLIGYENNGIGLLLTGKNYNNTFEINTIKDFEYGISYNTSTNGIQYTKTNFQLLKNTYDIYFKANATSWINQNMFFGGRVNGYYGIYLDDGENQSHNYDGNNFYNIGFEGNYDAITLKKATLNSFLNFRMLEDITNNCITTSSTCTKNLFQSNETSLALWNKINDGTTIFQKRNIYRMGIQTSDYKKGVEEMTILNSLPFIRRLRYDTSTDGNRKYLANEETFNTADDPFNKIEFYTVSLSGATTITINLDERYDYIEEDYRDFYVRITHRDGVKNLIIKTSNNTEIFNLSTYTGTTGAYEGLFYFKHITNTGSYKWIVEKID